VILRVGVCLREKERVRTRARESVRCINEKLGDTKGVCV